MSPDESEDNIEAQIAAALANGPDANWLALWDAVDALAEGAPYATWAGGDVVRTTVIDGEERPVQQMPYPVYAESVERVRDRLGALRLVVPFDWMSWDGVSRYRENQPELAGAPVGDAVRLLTAIQRSERFVDGSIEGALTSGLMQAALVRLRLWYDLERTSGSQSDGG